MAKKNCWEITKCGREQDGSKASELGVCPAATSSQYDGINGGTNAGRFCWAVENTHCVGSTPYAKKLLNCIECDFFKKVQDEESNNFVMLPSKLNKDKP